MVALKNRTKYDVSVFLSTGLYSRTSMARTLMARLPRLFELVLESLEINSTVADIIISDN